MTSATSYLLPGIEIAERLRERVPELRGVYFLRELRGDEAAGLAAPFVAIAYGGDRVVSEPSQGADVVAAQRWSIALVSDDASRAGIEADGQLLLSILRALQGWQPESAHSSLYRLSAPAAELADGRAIYPLAFECALCVDGSPD